MEEEKCTCDEGWEPEPCPYDTEINDKSDEDAMCTCCPHCRQQCMDDI